MATTMAFTVELTAVEGGWTQAQLRELPGVVTCAPTPEEAREAVVDALREYLESFTEPAADPPAASMTSLVRVVIDAALRSDLAGLSPQQKFREATRQPDGAV